MLFHKIQARNKKYPGSLTIEATISFVVFIMFMFLLLSIVRLCIVRTTLATATAETAKQIAICSYPLSYAIEWQNSENKAVEAYEQEMSLTSAASNGEISDKVSSVFGTDKAQTSRAVDMLTKAKDIIGGGSNAQVAKKSVMMDIMNEFEKGLCSIITGKILESYIDRSTVPFSKDDVNITIAKFPQSDLSYNKSGNSKGYSDIGLTKDMYTANDVVIGVEYKYKLKLPFVPTIDVVMREVAIETGWLYGGGNVITNREDGSVFDTDKLKSLLEQADTVYIGSKLTGKKYHKENCRTLWHGSMIKPLAEAKEEGYTPCQICYGSGS